jgi:hypothetical protein
VSKAQMLSRAFTGFCAAIAFFATLYTIWLVGPSIETRFRPVVSKLQILSMEPTADGRTKIKAGFTKLRDCEFVGIAWFVGDRPRDFERVSVVLQRDPADNGSPDRPLGYQRAGPWIIGMPPADLKSNSFARLSHRCHAFWTTITEFYP